MMPSPPNAPAPIDADAVSPATHGLASRILYITNRAPYPQNIGGNQRSELMRRALLRLGPVDLALCISPGGLSAEDEAVLRKDYGLVAILPYRERGKHFPWSLIRPLKPKLVDRLAHNLGRKRADYRADLVAAAELKKLTTTTPYRCIVGRYLMPTVKSGALDYTPVIVDLDDVDTEVYRSRINSGEASTFESLILQRHLNQLENLMPQLVARTERVFVANSEDRGLQGLSLARQLPNIPFATALKGPLEALPDTDAPIVMTVGSMGHPPNSKGVDRFLAEWWPKVRAAIPAAEYRIVGSGISDSQRAAWEKAAGVTVVGFVENIADEYRRCSVTVAPIYTGAGTNIKVVESLGYAKTTVLTPFAWRGYSDHLRDRESLRVALDGDLAAPIIDLLRDGETRRAYAARGKAIVDEHFSFDAFASVVAEGVRSLVPSRVEPVK